MNFVLLRLCYFVYFIDKVTVICQAGTETFNMQLSNDTIFSKIR